MRAFLSHVSEEAPEARALKTSLENAVPGLQVFVSAVDVHLGEAWLAEIDKALAECKVVLTLCSPASVRRPWLNFESGSGWTRRLPVVPVCHKGMRKDRLPDPMGIFQAVELTSTESCRTLATLLAAKLGGTLAVDFDPGAMLKALKIERPPRTSDIGIALCHGQAEWETGGPSIFSLAETRPDGLEGSWSLRSLADEREFLSQGLHKLSGLVVGSPWRTRMAPETITAVVEWVKSGGRLLLLGFELGDRHHDGNLFELTHHFGIDPACDIVGPPGYGNRKPYNEPVDFSPSKADGHPLTAGLAAIRLANVQTVRVEPGGTQWLRVGENVVYRPSRASVRYHNYTMTAPGGSTFEINDSAGWLAVAVEAPGGLCGAGGVHMIGTWDLFGRSESFGTDNFVLAARLLDWLSRNNG